MSVKYSLRLDINGMRSHFYTRDLNDVYNIIDGVIKTRVISTFTMSYVPGVKTHKIDVVMNDVMGLFSIMSFIDRDEFKDLFGEYGDNNFILSRCDGRYNFRYGPSGDMMCDVVSIEEKKH